VPLHELDQERREKAAFFRAAGASEGTILRALLHSTLRKPAWEEACEDLLCEYEHWALIPDEALERYGVTRGQVYGKVMDSNWVGQPTYAKIVSFPVPPKSLVLATVIPIHASRGQTSRRVLPRSRRRRATATRRGPPSQEDSEPSPDPVVELAAWRAAL
jgi:hypothetical protein